MKLGFFWQKKKKRPHEQVSQTTWLLNIESAVQRINSYSYFIPYIQKHEFEALLFADADAFGIVHEGIQRAVEDVLNEIPEPEEINTTEMGHPAKRLTEIY